jgi:hypothetical protein
MKWIQRERINLLFGCVLVVLCFGTTIRASDVTDVRATVDKVFQQLKAKDYDGLYEVLPATSRARITRERFTSALRAAQNIYFLDRMDVGAVKVAGDLAVVDTVLYGRVMLPVETEGKIVVQQYLVREEGKWRVATGDRRTVDRFLKANPGFSRTFAIRQPRIYVKQNGKWVEFTPPRRTLRT